MPHRTRRGPDRTTPRRPGGARQDQSRDRSRTAIASFRAHRGCRRTRDRADMDVAVIDSQQSARSGSGRRVRTGIGAFKPITAGRGNRSVGQPAQCVPVLSRAWEATCGKARLMASTSRRRQGCVSIDSFPSSRAAFSRAPMLSVLTLNSSANSLFVRSHSLSKSARWPLAMAFVSINSACKVSIFSFRAVTTW